MTSLAVKQSRDDSERGYEARIRDLMDDVNTQDVRIRNLEWSHQDAMADKDAVIEKWSYSRNLTSNKITSFL